MITKKEARVFLIYYGFLLLFLPMIIPPLSSSLTLSNVPQFLGFEDDLSGVSKVTGSPEIVASPATNGNKAVECQNGDYVRWDFVTPVKELDLTFNVSWMKLPIFVNESFAFGEIYGIGDSSWQDILITSLYCDLTGYRGWNLWTGIPSGRSGFVSSDVVYLLETNRWYKIRITIDLDKGIYKLFMDGTELASIADVFVPEDVYIDFFRLGVTSRGERDFVVHYDNVIASLLGVSDIAKQTSEYSWLPVQLGGMGLIGVGGYLWRSKKKGEA